MEGEQKQQYFIILRNYRKKAKPSQKKPKRVQKKKSQDDNQSQNGSDESQSSQNWSSEVVQPAIKSMEFRVKRGTRMKDLIKGKYKKDKFWEQYQGYFGGDLNRPESSQDQQDYQASSSGRDQFDSDFDLTDSYAGKRGRKKGSKIKKRRKQPQKDSSEDPNEPPKPKGKRGRKKKIVVTSQEQQRIAKILNKSSSQNQQLSKQEQLHRDHQKSEKDGSIKMQVEKNDEHEQEDNLFQIEDNEPADQQIQQAQQKVCELKDYN